MDALKNSFLVYLLWQLIKFAVKCIAAPFLLALGIVAVVGMQLSALHDDFKGQQQRDE